MTELKKMAEYSHITVTAPCDLCGLKARLLHNAVRSTGILYIEKPEAQKSCRASSLLELLRLDVRKGDKIRFIAPNQTEDFSEIMTALDRAC